MEILTVPADKLQVNDVLYFGDGLVFVVGIDPIREDGTLPLVTEGQYGMQYVDYVNPVRLFSVARTN